jgi:1,4-dihydroxy-2-naphthoate octaprenyltransferase
MKFVHRFLGLFIVHAALQAVFCVFGWHRLMAVLAFLILPWALNTAVAAQVADDEAKARNQPQTSGTAPAAVSPQAFVTPDKEGPSYVN